VKVGDYRCTIPTLFLLLRGRRRSIEKDERDFPSLPMPGLEDRRLGIDRKGIHFSL
jgi:hypothetical protein